MFIAALVKLLPVPKLAEIERSVPKLAEVKEDAGYYDQLMHYIFQPGQAREKGASVVGFMSVSTGAGTSFILNSIGLKLAQYRKEKTAVIDAARLLTISKADLKKWAESCNTAESDDIALLQDEPASGSQWWKGATLWQSSETFRLECLQVLREHFDHILIDCYSIKNSALWMTMTKLLDGFVLVAAAGQTRREEIERAEQVIEMAQGKILGFVLNKRRYPIPKWLYERI